VSPLPARTTCGIVAPATPPAGCGAESHAFSCSAVSTRQLDSLDFGQVLPHPQWQLSFPGRFCRWRTPSDDRVEANCPFCDPHGETVLAEGQHSFAILTRDQILAGSAMVIPRVHRETPFDLTPEEWADTLVVATAIRARINKQYAPDGYNVGWNCGAVAGQEVAHAHLHIIPRFKDEPLAGQGIRYALKQPGNRRPSLG
jgi:diadenosine tetraphosphate (Ap4A) HIT family hydrolase